MRPPDVPGALATVAPVLGGTAARLAGRLRALSPTCAPALPPDAPVGRVMPNVAAAVGRGVFLLAPGTLGRGAVDERDAICSAWSARWSTVAEDAVRRRRRPSSGCGPGFAALFVEALAEAGVAAGLPSRDGRELAAGDGRRHRAR